jgi:transposase
MITLKATLVTAPDELRGELEPLTDFKLIQACAALDASGDIADPAVAMRRVLASLASRWLELHQEIETHSLNLNKLTQTAAPDLVAAFGIGPDTAAEMLVAAGDNNDRIRSDAALAKLCGACPIPAGSGKTNGRHWLNRGGNRQANAAPLQGDRRAHAMASTHQRLRQTAHHRGLSKREIIRCLKRYLAREIYRLLPEPASPNEIASAA